MGQALAVQQRMRRDFVHTDPDESVSSARQTMRMGQLRHLLVVRGGVLLGILSYRDLLEWWTDAAPRRPERARVAELMRTPICILPDAPLDEAADCLCRYGLGCLPVVSADGRLVGLVTETDLLRAAYGLRGL